MASVGLAGAEGNETCSQDVIASAHLDSNTSLLTIHNGLSDTFPKRILNTSDTDKDEILREIVVFDLQKIRIIRVIREQRTYLILGVV